MTTFRQYYLGSILHPSRTFAALLADDRRLRYGICALGISIVLYTLVYVDLTIGGGAPSTFSPWLAIPKDVYYYYDQFLLAPSMVMSWLLAAAVIQLASKLFGGKGSFEDTLSILGLSIGVATLASLVHDLPESVLGAIGLINMKDYEVALNTPTIWRTILWTCYSAYFILFIVLFWKAVQVVQRVRRGPAFGVGLLGFVVYQSFFLIFNR